MFLHYYISSEFQSRKPRSEVADADPGSSAAVFSLKQFDAVTVVEGLRLGIVDTPSLSLVHLALRNTKTTQLAEYCGKLPCYGWLHKTHCGKAY